MKNKILEMLVDLKNDLSKQEDKNCFGKCEKIIEAYNKSIEPKKKVVKKETTKKIKVTVTQGGVVNIHLLHTDLEVEKLLKNTKKINDKLIDAYCKIEGIYKPSIKSSTGIWGQRLEAYDRECDRYTEKLKLAKLDTQIKIEVIS